MVSCTGVGYARLAESIHDGAHLCRSVGEVEAVDAHFHHSVSAAGEKAVEPRGSRVAHAVVSEHVVLARDSDRIALALMLGDILDEHALAVVLHAEVLEFHLYS